MVKPTKHKPKLRVQPYVDYRKRSYYLAGYHHKAAHNCHNDHSLKIREERIPIYQQRAELGLPLFDGFVSPVLKAD